MSLISATTYLSTINNSTAFAVIDGVYVTALGGFDGLEDSQVVGQPNIVSTHNYVNVAFPVEIDEYTTTFTTQAITSLIPMYQDKGDGYSSAFEAVKSIVSDKQEHDYATRAVGKIMCFSEKVANSSKQVLKYCMIEYMTPTRLPGGNSRADVPTPYEYTIRYSLLSVIA